MFKKAKLMLLTISIVLCSLNFDFTAVELTKKTETKSPIINAALRSGSLNNLVIYAKFKGEEEFLDCKYRDKTIKNVFTDMYNNADVSVKNYYSAISQGSLDLNSIFLGSDSEANISIELDHKREYYLPMSEFNLIGYPKYTVVDSNTNKYIADMYYSESGEKDIDISDGIVTEHYVNENPNTTIIDNEESRNFREFSLVYEVIEKADISSLKELSTDRNKDEFIDSMTIVLGVTPDKEIMSRVGWNELIWPHQHTLPYYYDQYSIDYTKETYNIDNSYINNKICEINGSLVARYNLCTSDFMLDEQRYAETNNGVVGDIGTIAHEIGHVLGLPDLYNYNDTADISVGVWDLMGEHNIIPQYLNSYMRKKAGWLNINQVPEVKYDGEYELKPIGLVGKDDIAAYMIKVPDKIGQYFIVEYRKAIGKFDGAVINSYGWKGTNIQEDGLVIYRVDSRYDYTGDYIMNGNTYGAPYNIYTFRDMNIMDFNKASAINGIEENSYGSIDKDKLDNSLTIYSEYGEELENSRVVITNIVLDEDKMKFTIDAKDPQAKIEAIDKNRVLVSFDEKIEIIDENKITLSKNRVNEEISIELIEDNKLYISLVEGILEDEYIVDISKGAVKDIVGKTMANDFSAKAEYINVESVAIDNKDLLLDINESTILTAIISPKEAINKQIKWSSDNINIATVDNEGRVTGVKTGTAIITATTVDGEKVAQCTVTVEKEIIKVSDNNSRVYSKLVLILIAIVILFVVYRAKKRKRILRR